MSQFLRELPIDPVRRVDWVDMARKDSATAKSTDKYGPYLYFYTRTCRYCQRMGKDIEQVNQALIDSTGKSIEFFDVRSDPFYMMAYERYALLPRRCFGVPFFYNVETEDFICGFADLKALREFALV